MAPNLKHFSQLTAPLADVKVIRVKEAASYQPRPAAPAADSASYWEWPTGVEPTQLITTEHIQANLVKAAAKQPEEQDKGKSALIGSNDDYWAEETVEDEPEHDYNCSAAPQQEQEVNESTDYWVEASYKNNGSDDYWNTSAKVEETATATPTAATRTTTVRNSSVNPSESAAYWQEETHDNKSMNDTYWHEARPVESADGDYWAWDVQTARMAESDGYWAWNSMSPSKLALVVSA